MRTALSGIVTLALTLSAAQARVGETEKQVAQRYGAPSGGGYGRTVATDPMGNAPLVYNFHDFTITVIYLEGVSVAENFMKFEGQQISDLRLPITAEELDAILASYSELGVKWKPGVTPGGLHSRWWMSTDGRLKAINSANQLQIATVRYLEQKAAAMKPTDPAKPNGS